MRKAIAILLVALCVAPAFAWVYHFSPSVKLSVDFSIGKNGIGIRDIGIQAELPLVQNCNCDMPWCVALGLGYVQSLDGGMAKSGLLVDALCVFSSYDTLTSSTSSIRFKAGVASRLTVDGQLKVDLGLVAGSDCHFKFELGDDVEPIFEVEARYMLLDMTGTDPLTIGISGGCLIVTGKR